MSAGSFCGLPGLAVEGGDAKEAEEEEENGQKCSFLFSIIVLLCDLWHADIHPGPLVQLAGDGEAVFFPEIDLDPVVDILDADTGPVSRFFVQDLPAFFLGHTDAVVLHGEEDVVSFLANGDPDLSFVHHAVEAVVDGIFDDGLEGDLVAQVGKAFGSTSKV